MPLTHSSTHWPDITGFAYRKSPVYTTLRTPISGAGDRRLTIDGPAYRFTLGWQSLDRVNGSHVQEACDALAGGWGRMWFWEWKPEPYEHTVTGTATTTYTLPAKEVTDLTARVNGVLTACTISSGTGANGEDRAIFGSNTPTGSTITFEFTGRHIRRVRLEANDLRLTDRPNDAGVWQGSVALLEVGS